MIASELPKSVPNCVVRNVILNIGLNQQKTSASAGLNIKC